MATLTRYPSAAGTNSGTFTNQANAYALGTDYMTHACVKNASDYAHFKGFGIKSLLPAYAVINSVTVYATYKVSTTSSTFSARLAGVDNTTVIGTSASNTSEPLTDSTISYAITPVPTLDQLADETFGVRWLPSRGSSNTAVTDSLNVIYVVVDYSDPPAEFAISGGDYSATYSKEKAFDSSNAGAGWWSQQLGNDLSGKAFIGWKFATAVSLASISAYTYTATGCFPNSVKIQGSNDGTAWTDVQTFAVTDAANTLLTWDITNGGTYSFWRVLANSSNLPSTNVWVIQELTMTEASAAPPVVTITNTTAAKISDETGKTTSTVTFQASTACDQWEARAGGSGQGSGLLVGSGSAINANTDTTFDVTYDELTLGDQTYRINVYGHNANGWTPYG